MNRLVIHGGFVPQVYFPEWYIEQSVQFWREFLRELPDGMTVALENVMEPEPSLLAEIARQVDDARLGLCLDVGHANTFVSHVPPLEWIAPMAPWLRHVHIHNNAGQMDLHDPLGKGVIQMERVLDEIVRLAPAATFTIENQDCAPSIDWLRRRAIWEMNDMTRQGLTEYIAAIRGADRAVMDAARRRQAELGQAAGQSRQARGLLRPHGGHHRRGKADA